MKKIRRRKPCTSCKERRKTANNSVRNRDKKQEINEAKFFVKKRANRYLVKHREYGLLGEARNKDDIFRIISETANKFNVFDYVLLTENGKKRFFTPYGEDVTRIMTETKRVKNVLYENYRKLVNPDEDIL